MSGKLKQKHKMELRKLQQEMKKATKKMPKAEGKEYAARMEREMIERHARELEEAGGGVAAAAGAAGADEAVAAPAQPLAPPAKTGKKSRAQRKREQREAAMEERRRAIEEEKAQLGDPREEELAAISAALGPGKRISLVKADGHCLFWSVAKHLSVEEVDGLPEPAQGAPADAAEAAVWRLRRLAADGIAADPEVGPFLHFEAGEDFEADPAAAVASYCRRLSTTPLWGGQPELLALARALRRPVIVHGTGGAQEPIAAPGCEASQPIEVSYHRKYYALGEHYNAVLVDEAAAAGGAAD